MPEKYNLQLPFPAQGVAKARSYREQTPGTTPDAQNVRTFGTDEERLRGGQRPGLRKAYPTELGSGNPVRLLVPFVVARDADTYNGTDESQFEDATGWYWDSSPKYWTDYWQCEYPSAMSTGKWPGRAWVRESDCDHDGIEGNTFTMLRKDLDVSKSNIYRINVRDIKMKYGGMYRAPSPATLYIYCRMDDTDPDPENEGVIIEYNQLGDITLSSYDSGELQNEWDLGNYDRAAGDNVSVEIDSDDVSVYLNGTLIDTKSVISHGGFRMGLGIYNPNWSNSRENQIIASCGSWIVTGVRLPGVPQPKQSMLCASSNGKLYVETTPGQLEDVTESVTLQSNYTIQAAANNQTIFIADYGSTPVLSGSDGAISGASHNELDASGIADWTTQGLDTDNHVVKLYGCDGPSEGVYGISSIASDHLTLDASAGTDGDCSYLIGRGPKRYDPTNGLVRWQANEGSVPFGCQIIASYRGRAVLARSWLHPQGWFMSRSGDPLDWEYGDTDAESAVVGQNSDAGQIGETITAVIPYSDDYLLFGCRSSLWVLRGDPMAGGVLDTISYSVGVLDRNAWTHGPTGEVFFMSSDGFYRIAPTGRGLRNESLSHVPKDLSGINTDVYEVSLAWDREQHGVEIFVTPRTAGDETDHPGQHWFYDNRTGAFWPDEMPESVGPFASVDYTSGPVQWRALTLGGRDGYLRTFDKSASDDDGTDITSYVNIGPMRFVDDLRQGVLTRLDIVLGEGSGDVKYRIKAAESCEAVTSAPVAVRGQLPRGGGRKSAIRKRVGGGAFAIELRSDDSDTWTLEQLDGVLKVRGRIR